MLGRSAWIALAGLLACGTRPVASPPAPATIATPTPTTPTTIVKPPPPPYAALLVAGTKLRFDITEATDWKGSLDATMWIGHGDWMACEVTRVVERLGRTLATLSCEDNDCDACSAPEWFGVGLAAPPGGTYVATAAGLWQLDMLVPADDAELRPILDALTDDDMLLDAEPHARHATIADPDELRSVEVAPGADGSWCWTYTRGFGGDVRCFGARGLITGGSHWGAEAVRFTLVD